MNNELTPAEVAEYRRLAEAATPGPWEMPYHCTVFSKEKSVAMVYDTNDQKFVVSSREAVPRLCDTVEALWAENEALRHIIASMTDEEPKTYAANNARVTVTHGHVGVTCEGGQWNE